MGLGGRALSKAPSSVTRSQAVKPVRSEGRFRWIAVPEHEVIRSMSAAKRLAFEYFPDSMRLTRDDLPFIGINEISQLRL
jgi:hypothetical protein